MTQDTLATVDIDRPAHYTSHPSGVECREIARHLPYNIGCAFKYLFRAGLKGDAITDYRKALNYIEDERKISNNDALRIDYNKIRYLLDKYINSEINYEKKEAVWSLLTANIKGTKKTRVVDLEISAKLVQVLIDRELGDD